MGFGTKHNLIIADVHKSVTTSLFEYLIHNDDIYGGVTKDIHFLYHYVTGIVFNLCGFVRNSLFVVMRKSTFWL